MKSVLSSFVMVHAVEGRSVRATREHGEAYIQHCMDRQ